MNIIFEKITKQNLDEAIILARTLFPHDVHDGEFWPESAFRSSLRGKTFEYFIVRDGKTAVGVTGYYKDRDKHSVYWIGWDGILPEFQGKGYGTASMTWTLNKIKEVGATSAKVWVADRDEDRGAQALYLANGFTKYRTDKKTSPYTLYYKKDLK